MPVGYRVEVYYRELNRATVGRGGPGGGWWRRLRTSMMDTAKAEAPVRSGNLKMSHRMDVKLGSNQWVQRFSVRNISDHAEYVHDGTLGPITAADGGKLVLPPYRGYKKIVVRSVSGQAANPWLDRACRKVAMRYGAVPISL